MSTSEKDESPSEKSVSRSNLSLIYSRPDIPQAKGQASGPSELRRYTLMRDDERPLQFDGEILASASSTSLTAKHHHAAVYRTRAGKYITEFSIWKFEGLPAQPETVRGKAAVHNSLDDAVKWFRPGTLTNEILKKLGRWDPEVVD